MKYKNKAKMNEMIRSTVCGVYINSPSLSMMVTNALDIAIGISVNGDDISTLNTSSSSTIMSSMISIFVQASVTLASINKNGGLGKIKSSPTLRLIVSF